MALFDWLFGKKPTPPDSGNADACDEIPPAGFRPVAGPPEFVRAVDLQKAYWTYDAAEQSQLSAVGLIELNWKDRLRLHHLNCLQRVAPGADRAASAEKILQSTKMLIANDSPYRPRPAMIWQGNSAQPGSDREPDLQGEFLNPSLTHFGCLEVFRVDSTNQPVQLDFVSFDELSGVVFAPPSLNRAAKLFCDDGRGEIVLVPMLYGLTWFIGSEMDRSGQMTRFVAHLDSEEFTAYGMGVGQQDLSIRSRDGGETLFGIGSIAEISFPLDMRDHRFDEKARSRGIDPDEVRAQMGGSPS
jgi:hypothetical protein